jgi:hypothetical protein
MPRLILRSLPRTVAGLGVAWALAGLACGQTSNPAPAVPAPPPPLSPVIWTENPDVVQRFAVNAPQVREMFDRSLFKLTSSSDTGTAWKRLGIKPEDVVGIKISTIGGPLGATHHALVQAICDGLQAAGVPPKHILIWDKDATDMTAAGYTPTPGSTDQVTIGALFPGLGYDPGVSYHSGVVGTLIWGDSQFVRSSTNADLTSAAADAVKNKPLDGTTTDTAHDDLLGADRIPQTSAESFYARPVTTICTKIINVPVLTDNPYVGIQGCLASLALGMTDNNRRFQGDPSFGDPAICEILDKDFVRRKVVLHVMDALIAQYAGGPHFDPQFTHPIGALYVSRDPVAIDSIVLKRLEKWRTMDKNGRIDAIGKSAAHVHDAVNYNLGTDDPQRIQLIELP